MDSRSDLREFLTTRRAKLTPEDVGLPDFGGRRRVPGLRREEVALVAGVSVEYYIRFERGTATGASDAVLDGITRALRLDDAERSHLHDLVHAVGANDTPRRPARPKTHQVRPSVQLLLDAMETVPAFVQNGRLDILAINRLGRAVFSEMVTQSDRPNFARFAFLDPRAPRFYERWDDALEQIVTILRAEAGRAPHDRALTDLVGELATRSDPFRALWASHDVRDHRTGVKAMHHPVVGPLELRYEALDLSHERGLQLIAYYATPGTPSWDALKLLGSWEATTQAPTRSAVVDERPV